MEKDLISVIVPCYNVEKWIGDCIESIKAQTYKNFEAIFVDDGSTDGTLNKLKQCCTNFDENKYKIISKPNGGLSSARNAGVSIAKGEYVYFLDSDDVIHPDSLKVLFQTISGADCAVCKMKWVNEKYKFDAEKYKEIDSINIKSYQGADENMSMFYCGMLKFSACNKLYKMSILQEIRDFPKVFNENTKYAEDLEFNTYYFEKVKTLNTVNKTLYYYRQRRGSLVYSEFKETKLTIYNAIEKAEALDEEEFKKSQTYFKTKKAMIALELLYRIIKSKNYKNKEVVLKLLNDFNENKKYVMKGTKNPFYLRIAMPLVPIYLGLAIKK